MLALREGLDTRVPIDWDGAADVDEEVDGRHSAVEDAAEDGIVTDPEAVDGDSRAAKEALEDVMADMEAAVDLEMVRDEESDGTMIVGVVVAALVRFLGSGSAVPEKGAVGSHLSSAFDTVAPPYLRVPKCPPPLFSSSAVLDQAPSDLLSAQTPVPSPSILP